MLEKQLDEEKEEIAEKVELYKAQITKMRSNMDLFKETVNNLQKANSELQKKCDSQPNGQQMQQINQLFQGLKEDNKRLATETQNLSQAVKEKRETIKNQKEIIQQQGNIIVGLQSLIENNLKQQSNQKLKSDIEKTLTQLDLSASQFAVDSDQRLKSNQSRNTGNTASNKVEATDFQNVNLPGIKTGNDAQNHFIDTGGLLGFPQSTHSKAKISKFIGVIPHADSQREQNTERLKTQDGTTNDEIHSLKLNTSGTTFSPTAMKQVIQKALM